MIKHQSSTAWLKTLNRSIASTRVTIKGVPADLEKGLKAVQRELLYAKNQNTNIWWIGNGGSNAICSHLSQDIMNKLGIRSMNINDSSLITCMANDFGYERVYLEPLKRLSRPKDTLLAISSSGKSKNILHCAEYALTHKMKLIAFSGFDSDNPLWKIKASVSMYVPSHSYGIVEIAHEALLHGAIETLFLSLKKNNFSAAVEDKNEKNNDNCRNRIIA